MNRNELSYFVENSDDVTFEIDDRVYGLFTDENGRYVTEHDTNPLPRGEDFRFKTGEEFVNDFKINSVPIGDISRKIKIIYVGAYWG